MISTETGLFSTIRLISCSLSLLIDQNVRDILIREGNSRFVRWYLIELIKLHSLYTVDILQTNVVKLLVGFNKIW